MEKVYPKMVIQKLVKITPQKAEDLLAGGTLNRPLSVPWARVLAGRIRADNWVETGETIQVDCFGRVVEGQHRLRAVAMSGKTVRMNIAFGVAPESFEILGDCRKRSLADQFGVLGIKNRNNLASAITWLWRYEGGRAHNACSKPTFSEAKDVLRDNPGIEESVTKSLQVRFLGLSGVVSVVHYLASKADREVADMFLDSLETGATHGRGNAARILRNRLIAAKNDRNIILPTPTKFAYMVKAWNAFYAKRNIGILRWRSDEDFPAVLS
jgi:hypothetical protein